MVTRGDGELEARRRSVGVDGVPRRRSGEKTKEREDQLAGVLVVLMRARERGPGL